MPLIIYSNGRGAFPWPPQGGTLTLEKSGGTLTPDGSRYGPYYRLPQDSKNLDMRVGMAGYRSVKSGDITQVNLFATHMGVKAIQEQLGLQPDGILGPMTAQAIAYFQNTHGLNDDAIVGPTTAKAIFSPVLRAVAARLLAEKKVNHTKIAQITSGHVGFESGWDPGAVGRSDPHDLGMGQINLPSHPEIRPEEAYNPEVAFDFIVRLVQANLTWFTYKTSLNNMAASKAIGTASPLFRAGLVRNAVAAYNLGRAGAEMWAKAGCPELWSPTGHPDYKRNVWAYIRGVEGQVVV